MGRDELDVELLMLTVQRNFDASAFPKDHAVITFVFSDLPRPHAALVVTRSMKAAPSSAPNPQGGDRRRHANVRAPYARRRYTPETPQSMLSSKHDAWRPRVLPSSFEACPAGCAFRELREPSDFSPVSSQETPKAALQSRPAPPPSLPLE